MLILRENSTTIYASRLLSKRQVAELLNVSVQKVTALIKSGALPAIKIGTDKQSHIYIPSILLNKQYPGLISEENLTVKLPRLLDTSDLQSYLNTSRISVWRMQKKRCFCGLHLGISKKSSLRFLACEVLRDLERFAICSGASYEQ